MLSGEINKNERLIVKSSIGLSGWWEDLQKGATSFYRAVNPFVSDTGVVSMDEAKNSLTTLYRNLNPFVTSTGAIVTSTSQLGSELTQVYRGLNPFIDVGGNSTIAGIDMELGKSDFWRQYGSTIAGIALTIVSAGTLTPLLATLGVGTQLATTIVLTLAGAGGQIVGGQINSYVVKEKNKSLQNAIDVTASDLEKIKKVREQLNAEEQKKLDIATAELQKAHDNLKVESVIKNSLPAIATVVGGYFLLS